MFSQITNADDFKFVAKMQAGIAIASGELLGSVVYLGTKQENPARLISFDLINNEIHDIEVPNAKQIWALDQYKGNIVIGTRNDDKEAEIIIYNVKTDQFNSLIKIPIESLIFDIEVVNDDVLISTYPNAKIFSYNIVTTKLLLLGSAEGETAARCLAVDYYSNKLFYGTGTSSKVYIIDRKDLSQKEIFNEILNNESYSYSCAYKNNRLYVGTQPGGYLFIINTTTRVIEKIISTKELTIDSITIHKDKVYFTARPSGALYEYSLEEDVLIKLAIPKENQQTRYTSIIGNDSIIGVTDNGSIWIHDIKNGKINIFDLMDMGLIGKQNKITAMDIDDLGNIYLGGHRSLVIYNKEKEIFNSVWVPGEIQSIYSDNQKIYLGVYEGADIYVIEKDMVNSSRIKNIKIKPVSTVGHEHSRPQGNFIKSGDKYYMLSLPFPGKIEGRITEINNLGKIVNSTGFKGGLNFVSGAGCGNLIAIGTSIYGEGVESSRSSASLVLFDVNNSSFTHDIDIGLDASVIYAVACADEDHVYGLSDSGYVFKMRISDQSLIFKKKIQVNIRYRTVLGKPHLILVDGKLYGTTGLSFFKINEDGSEFKKIFEGVAGYLNTDGFDNIYVTQDEKIYVLENH
jgi:hypothetical protein